jgi:UDP-N-acetylmuramate dehydrogenase
VAVVDHYQRLKELVAGDIRCDEPMRRHTTLRIGGPAALYVSCRTISDLSAALNYAVENGIDRRVIGKGSNILFADAGFEGIILVLADEFKRFSYPEEGVLVAGGGVNLGRLVNDAFGKSLSGLEFGIGIPGTVGGAVFMNAGIKTAWAGQSVSAVTVLRPGTGLVRYLASDLPWYYRCAGIPSDEVIVEVSFNVRAEPEALLHARMEAALTRRKKSQPDGHSAGSVFRNPDGYAAGRLIEEAGLKGHRIGGAQISPKHANFIMNVDEATAADVVALIVLAHDRVKEIHGIELQPEVRFFGFPE